MNPKWIIFRHTVKQESNNETAKRDLEEKTGIFPRSS